VGVSNLDTSYATIQAFLGVFPSPICY
jgi:hypothetical protein